MTTRKPRYVVEAIDIDGDNIPDGDLVRKYIGNKLVAQKFVAYDKLKKIADKAINKAKLETRKTEEMAKARGLKRVPTEKRERILYKNPPPENRDNSNRVIVEQDTGLGQYLKMGFGVGAGAAVGNAVGETAVDGFASGFDALFE